ncbi:MAG: leucyl aminopeptidase, partial [Acidimicrobiia bacterium]
MPISFTVASTAPGRTRAEVLAVPVFAEREFGPGADAVDEACGGTLAAFMTRAGFDGGRGQSLFVPIDAAAKTALLVGMGSANDVTTDDLRVAGALISQKIGGSSRIATTIVEAAPDDVDRGAAVQAVAEGFALGGYEFLTYRSKSPSKRKLAHVVLLGGGGGAAKRGVERAEVITEAVMWARDMVNTPARELSPDAFAKAAQAQLRGRGVKVEVMDPAEMRRLRLGGVLGVGQGSKQPPRFVKMTYAPQGARGSLAFVGKGVVFDSGGLSIKTGSGMETMKTDMAGAAAVIGAMSALAGLGVKTKVVAYTPMVENMPSGEAIRPGDVLTFRNGKTAEVLNTDAEGRLILADALSLASEAKPDAIVDLATLTGACVVALGEKIAGLMANNDAFGDEVEAASKRAGEQMWPLPLPKQYR